MPNETQKSILDSWDAFGGEYWKAADIREDADKFVITKVDTQAEEGKNKIILSLEKLGSGVTKLFGCNATNEYCLKMNSKSPKDLIGKKIAFKKVNVTNPRTKELVQGLRIYFLKDEKN